MGVWLGWEALRSGYVGRHGASVLRHAASTRSGAACWPSLHMLHVRCVHVLRCTVTQPGVSPHLIHFLCVMWYVWSQVSEPSKAFELITSEVVARGYDGIVSVDFVNRFLQFAHTVCCTTHLCWLNPTSAPHPSFACSSQAPARLTVQLCGCAPPVAGAGGVDDVGPDERHRERRLQAAGIRLRVAPGGCAAQGMRK